MQLTTSLLKSKEDKHMTIQDQPAYIIKMRAKPGNGDKLFALATTGMYKSGASDRFIILREDDDPNVLWNIEVFRSIEAKEGYETSALADELRDEILDLLAEPPMLRIQAHPYSALPLDPA
jgi:quinol monooxygenase YgiN